MKPAAQTDSSAGVLAPQCNVSCLVRIVRRQDGVAPKLAPKLRIERNQFFSAPPALLRPAHTARQPPVTRLRAAGTSTCTGSETPTWDEKFKLDVCPGTRLRRLPSLAPFLPISPSLPRSPPRCRNDTCGTRRGRSAVVIPRCPRRCLTQRRSASKSLRGTWARILSGRPWRSVSARHARGRARAPCRARPQGARPGEPSL
jgi:hypothetical protein